MLTRRNAPRTLLAGLVALLFVVLSGCADSDGDGVDDEVDTCPTRSNPVQTRIALSESVGAVDSKFAISPDASRVVFRSEDRKLLYSVPIDRRFEPRLLGVHEDLMERITFVRISPDSRFVAYVSEDAAIPISRIRLAPIQGGTPAKLATTAKMYGFEFSPDGDWIVYSAGDQGFGKIFSIPTGGGERNELTSRVSMAGARWRISADSSGVVYSIREEHGDTLYLVPINGGTSQAFDGPMPTTETAGDYRISADGTFAGYTETIDGATALVGVPVAGGSPYRVSGMPVPGRGVREFRLAEIGSIAVYRADERVEGVFGLYATDLANSDVDGNGIWDVCDRDADD